MARIGKIARLPQELREQLNHRLADGEPGGSLLRWLNNLPAAREVLAERFGGAVITKQNLSEWRKGGFREWQTRQDLFSDARKLSARAQEMREVAGDKLTDDLATVLAGQYAMVLRRWLGQATPELAAQLKVLHGLCGDIVALRRGDHAVAQLEFNLERWDFDREIRLKQMAARERAEGQGESKLVQVKNFHRGGEPCRLGHETPRKREAGDGATERTGVSGEGGRGVFNLSGLAALRDECEILGARQGESNLVQPKFFSGALGNGMRTTVEAGEYSRLAGLLSNISMFAKAGVSFSVSPGLGWSVGTVGKGTVEGAVGQAAREAAKTTELQARHRLTCLKPSANERHKEFCLTPHPRGPAHRSFPLPGSCARRFSAFPPSDPAILADIPLPSFEVVQLMSTSTAPG